MYLNIETTEGLLIPVIASSFFATSIHSNQKILLNQTQCTTPRRVISGFIQLLTDFKSQMI